ncbi:uncharacterized protein PG986_003978 [Apiospora aurea]|uniref:Uncharacterized protein n=1 Tax=Apiospora aurea TaxID=335848 RepID=A0ABR1QMU9_9PEZI
MGNKKRGNHGTEHHHTSHHGHEHHAQPEAYANNGTDNRIGTWSPMIAANGYSYSALQTPDGKWSTTTVQHGWDGSWGLCPRTPRLKPPYSGYPPPTREPSSTAWAGHPSAPNGQYLTAYGVFAVQQPIGGGISTGASASSSDRSGGGGYAHTVDGSATGEDDDDGSSSAASSPSEGVKRRHSREALETQQASLPGPLRAPAAPQPVGPQGRGARAVQAGGVDNHCGRLLGKLFDAGIDEMMSGRRLSGVWLADWRFIAGGGSLLSGRAVFPT